MKDDFCDKLRKLPISYKKFKDLTQVSKSDHPFYHQTQLSLRKLGNYNVLFINCFNFFMLKVLFKI